MVLSLKAHCFSCGLFTKNSVFKGWNDLLGDAQSDQGAYRSCKEAPTQPYNTQNGGLTWRSQCDVAVGNPAMDFTQGFHTYTIDWQPTVVKFYVDNTLTFQTTDTRAVPSALARLVFWMFPSNIEYFGGLLNLPLGSTQNMYFLVDFVEYRAGSNP
jgi:hypothetical protein